MVRHVDASCHWMLKLVILVTDKVVTLLLIIILCVQRLASLMLLPPNVLLDDDLCRRTIIQRDVRLDLAYLTEGRGSCL